MIKLSLENIEKIRENLGSSSDAFLQTHYSFFEDHSVPEYFIKELFQKTSNQNCWNAYWQDISLNQILSEDFIREFQDRINWRFISSWQILSEDFIQEFANKLNWKRISGRQKLSKEFITKNIDLLDLIKLIDNPNISEDTKTYIRMFI